MSRKALAKSIKSVSMLTGTFTLRSGQVSNTYFDKYLFESDPQLLSDIAHELRTMIPVDTDVLCGMELGGIPLVAVLSHISGIPAAFMRKAAKTYGTCKYAEGPSLIDKKLLIVEDVISSGGAVIDTVNMMRNDGLAVDRAICVIDRRPEHATALADAGITLEALFTMSEIEDA